MDQFEQNSNFQDQTAGSEPAAPFTGSASDNTEFPAAETATDRQNPAAAFFPGIPGRPSQPAVTLPGQILPNFPFPGPVRPEIPRPEPARPVIPLPGPSRPIPGPGPVVRPIVVPVPNIPCLTCGNNQWIRGGIRFLNAATGYNAFMIAIDNQTIFSNLNFAEITQYRQTAQGYHTFTIMATNGYVYLQRTMFVGDGMATIAIVNASNGIDLVDISDTACPTGNGFACFRVSNLAYYSGAVNVSLGNLLFNSVNFRQTTGFSRVRNGNYPLSVSRSARPGVTLLNTTVSLAPNRIYTLYVLNWNPSSDTIRTLLVEDRRS